MISEDHPGLLDVEEAAELHEAFEMVDIDGSGQLPVRAMGELVDALVEMQAGRQESLIQQQPEPISCILTGVRMPSDMEMYDMMHIADPSGKGVMTLQYFAAAVADFVKKVKKELGIIVAVRAGGGRLVGVGVGHRGHYMAGQFPNSPQREPSCIVCPSSGQVEVGKGLWTGLT